MSLSTVAQAAHDEAVLPLNKKWHTNPDKSRVAIPLSTVVHGDRVTIEAGVKIGICVQLFGEVHLLAGTEIGNWCKIDGCTVRGSRIGDYTVAQHSSIKDSQIGELNWIQLHSTVMGGTISDHGAIIGPEVIADGVKIGIREWYTG